MLRGPSSSPLRRLTRSSLLVSGAVALLALVAIGLRARTSSLAPLSPLSQGEIRAWGVLTSVAAGALWWWWGARRPRLVADVTVGLVAAFVAGSVAYALRDTPWGLHALTGDMVLRTEAVTRFTESVGSADYAYRDLPSYYPPLVPWVEARLALLTGLPGWQMIKHGQIALALVVPLAAYVLWARVTRHPTAALIVATTTLFAANVYKVDQWLPLAVLLPWWLDAFRDVRRPGVRAWPAWAHGVIAGLMLSTYTFYFLPLALATVLGLGADFVRRRPWRPTVVRYAAIVGVGLLVSAWYWLPALLARLGDPADDRLQLRWFNPDVTLQVPVPLAGQAVQEHLATGHLLVGLLAAAGVVYMVATARVRADAEALLLVALSTLLTLAVGLIAAALNRPFLSFKAMDLLVHAMMAAGVLAVFAGVRAAERASGSPPTGVAQSALGGLVVVALLAGTLQYAKTWTDGEPVRAAYQQPLPDGSSPGPAGPSHASPRTPSVNDMRAALGEASQPGSVVLTSRFDLLATTPFHLFMVWSSINSHPYGEFEQRVALVRRLAAETDPAAFTRLARSNPLDAIDAFVLQRRGTRFVHRFRVDAFPQPPRPVEVTFRAEQFAPDDWEVAELGEVVVITAR